MKSACLWYDTSPEPALPLDALQGDHTAEVVVIGGGITGLSTALHLAEAGIKVTLLEAGDIPSGGSGLNVGLVNAGLWIPPDDILETLGPEDGERANRVLGGAPAEVFKLIEKHHINCDATRTGTLYLAHNDMGAGELERRFKQFQQRGAPVELLEDEACRQRIGTQRIRRALLDKRAGTLNPTAYTRGLARAASGAGARLHIHSAVTGIERQGDDWCAFTAKGSVKAPRLVIATNAYTEDHWNQVRQHFFCGHFFQVASRPLSDELAGEILPERQGAWDTRTVLSSLRRDAEGRLLLGSLGRGESKPLAFIKCWADRIKDDYFPQLGKLKWEYTWTGQIGFTPDHMLRLFSPARGILAVSGYNGRGVTTGTVVGKGFAKLIQDDSDEELPLPIRYRKPVSAIGARSFAYESGFTLYHAGQCLRVVA
ncbi:NAD(P)/FAD-dependent oxidoreductase [Halomonas sp. M20]|uniref:L-pipecolate oxidase n=1 Tax=Halomonas sp. M20 TaxID=2763264 RepID=UPI001D0B02D6|nr:FAD-binding oxidoreductase [Halomonas sp. M20]